MRKIAAEAGCTIGLINHWFESKDDLLEAVLDEALSAAVARANDALDQSAVSPERVFQEFLPLDDQRIKEQRIWLVFWALGFGRPGLSARSTRRLEEGRRRLIEVFRTLGVPACEVESNVDLLMATIDGIMVNALADPEHWTPKRQIATLRRLLARAIDGLDRLDRLNQPESE